MRVFKRFAVGLLLAGLLGSVGADEFALKGDDGVIPLYKGKPFLHVLHEGRSIKVQRIQDPDYELKGYFAKTARKCPPFCIRPIDVDPRVRTVGEIEVFNFMENELRDGKGLLIDARTPSWHKKGTIPGSVNYPFTELSKEPDDPEMIAILKKFGARPRTANALVLLLEKWGILDDPLKSEKWDFSNAKHLLLWCNGPQCGQSPHAIRGLLKAGYPPQLLRYYRGGMQMWELFGLTTVAPEE